MNWRNRLCPLLSTLVFLLIAAPAVAQDEGGGADGNRSATEQTDGPEAENESRSQDDAGAKQQDPGDDEASEPNKDRESEHGSYEWKPSYGAGLEYGLFFTQLERWNSNLLRPNDAPMFDVSNVSSFNFVAEASLFEGSRFSLFAGLDTPFSDNPDLLAVYGGIEPAFAFRRGDWEMGLGLGVGLGSISLSTDAGDEFDAGLVTLRPTFELRRYINEMAAGYARFGFNQWLPFSADSDDLAIEVGDDDPSEAGDENRLYEGGVYAAIGVRFGQYPEHVKHVPDTDGDGLRDDIDDCPEEVEDEDDFEDWDGCPETDNDDDGVPDDQDECPQTAEDQDGFEDDDGCPDPDNDGDGLPDEEDECPDQPEDEDGFEDDDGCPDPDNDQDGIEDEDDACPDQAGIPAEDGCPSELVSIEDDRLVIDGPIQFEQTTVEDDEDEEADEDRPRTQLTAASEKLLDEVAQVLDLRTDLKKLEVRAYPGEDTEEGVTQTRADNVVDYLVEAGAEQGRLEATGVTADELEDDEEPEERVEFHILERSENDEPTSDDSE